MQDGVAHDHARHHIAVPGQVFGRAVEDHIYAVLKGIAQVRGAEGIVHKEKCTAHVRDLRQFGQVRV